MVSQSLDPATGSELEVRLSRCRTQSPAYTGNCRHAHPPVFFFFKQIPPPQEHMYLCKVTLLEKGSA